jgi:hypothetical protein
VSLEGFGEGDVTDESAAIHSDVFARTAMILRIDVVGVSFPGTNLHHHDIGWYT